ncbi:ATP-binding protein [Streptomyces sp. NPDC058246]|uniref:ATP-binding protein n=1 Tax=Streptomyces sp. NPDC058246 TaxID=3346400 RepID=UPI0036EAAB2B
MPPRVAGSTSLMEASPHQLGETPDAAFPAFCIAFASEPSCVKAARHIAKAWMHRCRMQERYVDELLVVVSELCTNAILHGRHESVCLRARMSAQGGLRLEVHDKSPSAIPQPQHVAPGSESGRGLFLVDDLVTELGGAWGFAEDGAVAWCEVPASALLTDPAACASESVR